MNKTGHVLGCSPETQQNTHRTRCAVLGLSTRAATRAPLDRRGGLDPDYQFAVAYDPLGGVQLGHMVFITPN
jgi:hypothetical protein